MFEISASPLSSLLFVHFARLWGVHIVPPTIDLDSFSLDKNYKLLLSPRTLGLLSYIDLSDHLVEIGTKLEQLEFFQGKKKISEIALSQDYLYPYFLSITVSDFLEILEKTLTTLETKTTRQVSLGLHDFLFSHYYCYQNIVRSQNSTSSEEKNKAPAILQVSFDNGVWSLVYDDFCTIASQSVINDESLGSLVRDCGIDLGTASQIVPGSVEKDVDLSLDRIACFSLQPFDINRAVDHSLNIAWKVCSSYPNQSVKKHFLEEINHFSRVRNRQFAYYEKLFSHAAGLKGLINQTIQGNYFRIQSKSDNFVSFLSSVISYDESLGFFAEDPINKLDIDRPRTIFHYITNALRLAKTTVQNNLPADTLGTLFGLRDATKDTISSSGLIYPYYRQVAKGLGVGKQIPPCYLVLKSNEPREHIYELLQGGKLVLLWFVGLYQNHAKELTTIFEQFKQSADNYIDSYLVTNQYNIRSYDGNPAILGDAEGEIHKKFGAPVGMLYLIRPDGYLMRKGQAKDSDKLLRFLKKISDFKSRISDD